MAEWILVSVISMCKMFKKVLDQKKETVYDLEIGYRLSLK